MEDDTKSGGAQRNGRKPIAYEIAAKDEENEGWIILDQCVLC